MPKKKDKKGSLWFKDLEAELLKLDDYMSAKNRFGSGVRKTLNLRCLFNIGKEIDLMQAENELLFRRVNELEETIDDLLVDFAHTRMTLEDRISNLSEVCNVERGEIDNHE